MSARIDIIISTIEKATGITKIQMESPSRKREIVIARQLSMYFIRLDDLIITQRGIGAIFGNRDHSTVIHAFQTVDDHYSTDKNYKAFVNDLCNQINPKYSNLLGQLSLETYSFLVNKQFNKWNKKELSTLSK